MKSLKVVGMLGLCLAMAIGCSAKTKEETKEALKESGEAAKSAAEDTKVNVKKAGEVIESGVEKAKEEFRTPPPSSGADDPADPDAVPESQEAQP